MKYSVQIKKMIESSGNHQFFVYAIDNEKDNSDIFESNKLNFSCHQSKYFNFDDKEPIERATYDAMELLKFFSLNEEDLILPESFSDEDKTIVKNTFKFWRF